ncbi:MAG TPA: MaoC/PaaZ C-terminal domain-containing protein [Actinomycetota bacterium]
MIGPAVDDELPPLARTVTREDVRAYAEASGDRNPLHLDDTVARAAGFDGVIAHGMFTMGHMAACVTRWAGPGAVVERLSAQFRAPVAIGEGIVAGGRVTAVEEVPGGEVEGEVGAGEVRGPWLRVTVAAWVTGGGRGSGRAGGGPDAPEATWPIRKGEVVVRIPAA